MKILIDGQTLLTPEINRGIGVYFRNVVENLLLTDFVNDFYITAPSASLNHLSAWAREKLCVVDDWLVDANPQKRSNPARRYTDFVNELIEKENFDLYWSPNPLMTNVFLPAHNARNCRFAATVFDLIPAVMKEPYQANWPRNVFADYERKLELLESDYDLLLHISRHTESDCKRILRVENKTNVVTPLGVDKSFRPYPFPAFTSEQNYILYPGGFDPRKNMTRALEAFAEMKILFSDDGDVSSSVFTIVCDVAEESRRAIMSQAQSLGILDKVQLTGFVDNASMIKLYQEARCVFFPSLYEGFGLPVLEALACGVPVAASNNSAIPEVAGDFAHYFDPLNLESMAGALYRALKEPRDWESRQRRHRHARLFSWTETAQMTLSAFAGCVDATDVGTVSTAISA